MKRTVISTRNLSIGYPKTQRHGVSVLHDNLSFDLYSGELTCLLGANGAGKSTLLRTLTALQSPAEGQINLNGKDLSKYTEQDLSMLVGVVLTDPTSVGGFTVKELVELGRYPYTGFFGKLKPEDHIVINKAMTDVNIIHKKDSYIAELSDGERQKVMIAKVLAQECPIIILDEPTAFLDVVNRTEIMILLHELAVNQNKTILLSTHDIEQALTLADRLWLLSKDKGLKCGVTEDIILSDLINDYIGDRGISFDKQSGRFLSEQQSEKKVYIEASGDLYYWAKNFLIRNGFSLATEPTEKIYLKILSPTEMFFKDNGQEYKFSTFEELGSYLIFEK